MTDETKQINYSTTATPGGVKIEITTSDGGRIEIGLTAADAKAFGLHFVYAAIDAELQARSASKGAANG